MFSSQLKWGLSSNHHAIVFPVLSEGWLLRWVSWRLKFKGCLQAGNKGAEGVAVSSRVWHPTHAAGAPQMPFLSWGLHSTPAALLSGRRGPLCVPLALGSLTLHSQCFWSCVCWPTSFYIGAALRVLHGTGGPQYPLSLPFVTEPQILAGYIARQLKDYIHPFYTHV